MYSTIYWITRLDGINTFFIVLNVVAAIATVVCLICWVTTTTYSWDKEEDVARKAKIKDGGKKYFYPLVFLTLFFGLINVFVPTKNEAILIYAGGKTYEYIQSDTSLQKLPFRTTEYIKVLLEREIDEIKNDKTNNP